MHSDKTNSPRAAAPARGLSAVLLQPCIVWQRIYGGSIALTSGLRQRAAQFCKLA